jgi:hypothetical protein
MKKALFLANLVRFIKTQTIQSVRFYSRLEDQLNRTHPLYLYLLSNKINWTFFDQSFSKHYSSRMGKPGKPIF